MSNNTDRAKGKLEEIGGTIQKGVGKAIGNKEMELKGAAHEAKGKGKQAIAKAGERVKGAVEQVVGSVKAGVGDAVGNDRLHAEGKAENAKGKLRNEFNK